MLIIKVLMIAVGAQFAATGTFDVWWGRRFRDGHPLPLRMGLTSTGTRLVNREWGGRLAVRGGLQVLLFGLVALAGALWLVRNDRMTIGAYQVRLFSPSSHLWLDAAEMFALLMLALFVQRNSAWLFRERRPEPPRVSSWTPFPKGQSRRTGRLWILCGSMWCLLVAGLCVFLTVRLMTGDTQGAVMVLTPPVVVLSAPAYVLGLNLRRHGRRHLARVLDSPAAVGDEPFVLYLRSFVDDALLDAPQERPSMPALTQFLVSGRSEEEQIARAARRIGPLVAVGEPGERLPYAGADRFYLPLDDWQKPVSDLIRKARLVVLSAGTSEGTLWELRECMRLLPPSRVVLLVALEADAYEKFRRVAGARIPRFRPDPRIKNPMLRSSLQALIRYDDQWRPTFVWLESEAMRISRAPLFRDLVYVALKHALAPSVARLTRAD